MTTTTDRQTTERLIEQLEARLAALATTYGQSPANRMEAAERRQRTERQLARLRAELAEMK